jgi:hypothetical protein
MSMGLCYNRVIMDNIVQYFEQDTKTGETVIVRNTNDGFSYTFNINTDPTEYQKYLEWKNR